DHEIRSDFQLVAGTNRELSDAVRRGRFRDDLLARINLWTFRLPGLSERPEDVEPNLDYELDRFAAANGRRVTLSREARAAFVRFATSGEALWSANFRDFNAAVVRMATLAPGGRITTAVVEDEIARLRAAWGPEISTGIGTSLSSPEAPALVERLVSPGTLADLDRFDRVQLEDVLAVC